MDSIVKVRSESERSNEGMENQSEVRHRRRKKMGKQRCTMKRRRRSRRRKNKEEEETYAAAVAAAGGTDCYAYNLEEEEPMYADDAPVVFLLEKEDPTIKVKNDYEFTREEFDSYYAYSEEQVKSCGCTAACFNHLCCSSGSPQPCRDNCGCRCYKDSVTKEYRRQLRNCHVSYERKMIRKLTDYAMKVARSGGFDIKCNYWRWPHCAHLLAPMEPLHKLDIIKQDLLKKLAILAIRRYNQMKGMEYRCLRFVKAVYVGYSFLRKYYITFVASNDKGKDKPRIFQALVSDRYCINRDWNYERKVHLCRPKPAFNKELQCIVVPETVDDKDEQ